MLSDSSSKLNKLPPVARKWGIVAILLGLLAFIGPQFIVGGLAYAWLGQVKLTASQQFIAYGVGTLATLGLLVQLLKHYHATFRDLGLKEFEPKYVGYGLLAFPVYLVVSDALTRVAAWAFPKINLNQVQDVGFTHTTSVPELVMVFISLVILPPLVEELLFRGLIFRGLLKYASPVIAAIFTSLVFGLAHGQWNVAIDTFGLSLILCFLAYKTESLWPSMALHATKNLVAFVLVFILQGVFHVTF